MAVAVALLGLAGWLRRRWVASMGVVVVSLGITQVLKRFVLERPYLVEASEKYTGNSFPSGHTTIAISCRQCRCLDPDGRATPSARKPFACWWAAP